MSETLGMISNFDRAVRDGEAALIVHRMLVTSETGDFPAAETEEVSNLWADFAEKYDLDADQVNAVINQITSRIESRDSRIR